MPIRDDERTPRTVWRIENVLALVTRQDGFVRGVKLEGEVKSVLRIDPAHKKGEGPLMPKLPKFCVLQIFLNIYVQVHIHSTT